MPPHRSGMGHHHLSLLSFCDGVDSWYNGGLNSERHDDLPLARRETA